MTIPSNAVGNPTNHEIIYTEAYLNDPIRFEADPRLVVNSIVEDAMGESLQTRDLNGFVLTDINPETTSYYPSRMFSPLYNRLTINDVINTNFNFF